MTDAALARLRRVVADHSGLAPVTGLLGARIERIEAGHVWVEFPVKDEFRIPAGPVQGGMVTAYADHCMALAAYTLLEPPQVYSTSSLTVSFLAPVTRGTVVGEGTVVKKGRSVLFLEAILRDREGNEYAHATSVGSIRRAGAG